MKNGYFIGNINPTFSDKPIYMVFLWFSFGWSINRPCISTIGISWFPRIATEHREGATVLHLCARTPPMVVKQFANWKMAISSEFYPLKMMVKWWLNVKWCNHHEIIIQPSMSIVFCKRLPEGIVKWWLNDDWMMIYTGNRSGHNGLYIKKPCG